MCYNTPVLPMQENNILAPHIFKKNLLPKVLNVPFVYTAKQIHRSFSHL